MNRAKIVHLVIADLFLPEEFSASKGLHLPYLEKMLFRGAGSTSPATSMEALLCGMFGVDAPAQVSAAFDGLADGCWLRADPVHVRLQRDQVVLLPNVAVRIDEAAEFCASLNEHFRDEGLEFFAPHPERWYVRMQQSPDVVTVPLSQAAGRNIRGSLPTGKDARLLHRIFNETQMLLHAHRINEAREVPVNSLWFWGGGTGSSNAICDFAAASSDEVLVEMLAVSSHVPFTRWQPAWDGVCGLLVFCGLRSALQRGDLDAWRDALQAFETGYARPLWQALRRGEISELRIDILGADGMQQVHLRRADTFAFWRRSGRLSDYAGEMKLG